MKCPYCEQEMKRGYLRGDGRTKLRWYEDGKRMMFVERLVGVGIVEATKYALFREFKLDGEYCKTCKKLIIDTGIME